VEYISANQKPCQPSWMKYVNIMDLINKMAIVTRTLVANFVKIFLEITEI